MKNNIYLFAGKIKEKGVYIKKAVNARKAIHSNFMIFLVPAKEREKKKDLLGVQIPNLISIEVKIKNKSHGKCAHSMRSKGISTLCIDSMMKVKVSFMDIYSFPYLR